MPLFAFQAANPDINLSLIAPELIAAIAGVIVMLVDAFAGRAKSTATAILSIVALVAAGVAAIWLQVAWTGPRTAFNGMIVLDQLRLSFTLVFILVSLLTVLISMVWLKS